MIKKLEREKYDLEKNVLALEDELKVESNKFNKEMYDASAELR